MTDIDDKIINRANDEGRPWEDIAAKCESVWWKAMDGIGNARPDDIPHATAYVDEMVEMIGQLVEIGRAYPTDDGVYLSVETVEDYGLLAHQSLDEMLAGGGEREVFGAELKTPPRRLRAVEARQARRAGVAVAVGRRAGRAGTASAS